MSLSLAWYNNKDHKTFSVTYLGLSSEMAIKTIFNEMMTSKYISISLPEYIRYLKYIMHIYRVFSKGQNEVGPSKSLIFWTFYDVLDFF